MNKNDFFYLGYFSKTVGIKGELLLNLDVDDAQKYKKMESLFIELNNNLIPFFITSVQIRSNSALVKIDGIDTPQKAAEYVSCSAFLPLSNLPKLSGKNFYFHEVPGFTVIDAVHGNIGVVETVLDFPQQAIFQIKKNETEILIPATQEFIQKIDRATKTIFIQAPDGLIDIYTSGSNTSNEEE